MDSTHVRRLGIGLLLLGVLCGLIIGFGIQFNGTDAYPDPNAIEANYADHVGREVHLWGVVTETDDGVVTLRAEGFSVQLTEPPPATVEVGDRMQVVGTLRPDRRLETNAYHVQTPREIRRMYGVSIVGILLAAGAFLRRFQLDTDRWRFTPREGG